MSGNARRVAPKKRLVTREECAKMLTVYDKHVRQEVTDLQTALEELREYARQIDARETANRARPWWRRFLGLP